MACFLILFGFFEFCASMRMNVSSNFSFFPHFLFACLFGVFSVSCLQLDLFPLLQFRRKSNRSNRNKV